MRIAPLHSLVSDAKSRRRGTTTNACLGVPKETIRDVRRGIVGRRVAARLLDYARRHGLGDAVQLPTGRILTDADTLTDPEKLAAEAARRAAAEAEVAFYRAHCARRYRTCAILGRIPPFSLRTVYFQPQ